MGKYILAVDQSTQGTKGLLFDEAGYLVARVDKSHKQIINDKGWVEHDPEEFLANTLTVLKEVIQKAGIDKNDVVTFGISNQRETTVLWDKTTGKPVYNAIVWQCSRAKDICEEHSCYSDEVKKITGLNLSPYFPASKVEWILRNVPKARELMEEKKLAIGTVDSFLVYHLSKEKNHKTDYSNASRTQLFDIYKLAWSEKVCDIFGIDMDALPEVCMSDSCFGMTDIGGYLEKPIPIHGVLGDSHGALFGQDCRKPGQIKTTYGTGSSVMMNIGEKPLLSDKGIVTSLAWGMNGKVEYVFEGNLNYTGAVISWLKKDVGLIETDAQATDMALAANPNDKTYFVPAFTGLGAPYWDSEATGLLTGVTRTTGKAEIAKACLECIAYQITDLVELMREESGLEVEQLRVDGGPTASTYLMQFQSDMGRLQVSVPDLQELSGMGAAYAAGIATGVYDPDQIYEHVKRKEYTAQMEETVRAEKYAGWKQAVTQAITHN